MTYQVPKRKVQVVVHLHQGEPLRGCLFVSSASLGEGAQRLSARLAETDHRFLAFSQENGVRLISRDWILRVDVLREEEAALEAEPGAGEPISVACHLANGSVLAGTVAFAMPPGRQRLIDYVNSVEGFVPLRHDGTLSLIHQRHVIDWAGK